MAQWRTARKLATGDSQPRPVRSRPARGGRAYLWVVQMLIGDAMWKAGTGVREEAVAAAEVLADKLYAAEGLEED